MNYGKMNPNDALKFSPLADLSALPLREMATVKDWGKTLIIAPHPDDESLGCGGAMALLRQFEIPVSVLVMSDGTLSHPNSRQFPAVVLRDLREREMISALNILGVEESETTFLRFKDRSVPNIQKEDFIAAVKLCQNYLQHKSPQTILLPWRRDPHPDHRATTQIISEAVKKSDETPKFIEYPIWIWELAETADAPRTDEVLAFRLDISRVVEQKKSAIMAHESQTTDLITDDPEGFRLTAEILANFAAPFEIYLETIL